MIVGIDLGTTNSLIGAWRSNDVELFTDDGGEELLPSAVANAGGGGVVVGRPARNRRLIDPEGTVTSIKRHMGRRRAVHLGDRELSPPQISALILGALLDRAEAVLEERPDRAIITVPAYFDDAQRQATRDAGELAGLVVERLVNEPTAAAMAHQSGDEQAVLVYDLGGGTFDVSVLERDEGLLEVLSSRGDTRLGGDDVDGALYRWAIEQLGAEGTTVERDPGAQTRLLEAVERAKIALSDRDEVRLFDPFIAGSGERAVNLDLRLTRDELEAVARPFVQRTLDCIDQALRDADMSPGDLDRVLLVGGTSKMPLVERMVAEHLGMPAQRELDADRAVAQGAVMLAGRAMGEDVEQILVDITPHTLAAGVGDGPLSLELVASPLIPRGTVVPVERRETYYTTLESQEAVSLPIAQGEERALAENTVLGELRIDELPESPAGSPVEVTFRLDISGVLEVSATHLPSGKGARTRIAGSPVRLTARERQAARQEVDALRADSGADETQPLDARATEADRSLAAALIKRADRAIERNNGDTSSDALEAVQQARAQLEQAVEMRAPDLAERTEALSDALLDLM